MPSKLAVEALGMALIVGLGVALWFAGYNKGKDAMRGDMAALQRSFDLAAAEAQGRSEAVQKALAARNAQITEDYIRDTKSLAARAAAAERRFADLLRRNAASGGDAVSPASSPAPGVDGAASGDELERARRAAAGIAHVGQGCEADAARLKALQDWAKGLQAIY